MKKHLLILIALITGNLLSLNAQDLTQTVRGTVIDAATKSVLPGATIILLNTKPIIGTASDGNGNFRLTNVAIGRIDLKISYIGYQDKVLRNLQLSTGKELVVKVDLEEKVITTNIVEITATQDHDKTKNEMATVSGRTFTFEETNRYAGSMGDPARMAQNFAGVMSAGDSRNDIVIRGNSPTGLLWRLEGIEIPNPNHFGSLGTTGGPVSMLNNNLLTNSDFFTGAFPAEYGNALSGVFDLSMRTGNNEKYEFVGQIGFNGFEFGAEGPFSKKHQASFLVNYRYSTLAVFDLIGLKSITGSSVPQYQDIAFKIDLPTKKAGKFMLFGLGGKSFININDRDKDSTEFSYGLAGTNTDFGANMGVVGLSHIYFFNKNTRIKTTVSGQSAGSYTLIDSLGKNNNPDKAFFRNHNNENKLNFSTNLLKKIGSKNVLIAGFNYQYYKIKYIDSVFIADENDFRSLTNADGNLGIMQGFSQWKHKFNDMISMNIGLHYQYFNLNNSQTLEPRLGLQYQISPKNLISFGYGMHSQTQPKMLYFVESENANNAISFTNHNLGFTNSNQFVLGYTNFLSTNWRFKAEAYFQQLSNVPVSETLQDYSVLNEGAYFAINLMDSLTNKGTGKNYGIEFTLEKYLSNNYYILVTTSLFRSLSTGYNGNTHPTAFDNKYVINALAGYEWKLTKKSSLNFDIKAVFSGGKPYIPFDIEKSKISNQAEYIWEEAYEKKLADYFRLDFRIAFKINTKHFDQEWAVDLQNLTNHQNVFMQSWDSYNKVVKTDYQQGFYPMVLYRIYF